MPPYGKTYDWQLRAADDTSAVQDCASCSKNLGCSQKRAIPLNLFPEFVPLKFGAINIPGPLPKSDTAFNTSSRSQNDSKNRSSWYHWGTSAWCMSLKHFWNTGFKSMKRQRHFLSTTDNSLHLSSYKLYVRFSRLLMRFPQNATHRLVGR